MWERSNLEMIVGVPCRKKEDDVKMNEERLKGEVVVMDKDYKEKLKMKEHVPRPEESAHYTRRLGGVRVHGEMFLYACRCSRGRRERRTRKTAESGLKRNGEALRGRRQHKAA